MTGKDGSDRLPADNPLLSKLIAQGAETAVTLRGFIGAIGDDHVRLYPRISNLSESVEIARADILHSVAVPHSVLGAVILWVKKDAKFTIRKVTATGDASTLRQDLVELRKGRLRMQMKRREGHLADCHSPVCPSICHSECLPCLGLCQEER